MRLMYYHVSNFSHLAVVSNLDVSLLYEPGPTYWVCVYQQIPCGIVSLELNQLPSVFETDALPSELDVYADK
jgi:hypothetical protein